MEIKSLQQAVSTQGVKLCVYGFAGAGKTLLIATLPGRGLVASAEAGLLSLAGQEMAGEVAVADVTSMDDLRDVYRLLQATDHGYSWVALDSISEIAEVVLASEKRKTKDPRQAYGALIDEMGSIMRAFRDLPGLDVYFSAKAERVKDDESGRVQVQLMLPGAKLAQAIPYLFDEVFHLVVLEDKATGEVTRWLQTRRDARSDCKDRSGRLDPFEPADLGVVIAKIKNRPAQ